MRIAVFRIVGGIKAERRDSILILKFWTQSYFRKENNKILIWHSRWIHNSKTRYLYFLCIHLVKSPQKAFVKGPWRWLDKPSVCSAPNGPIRLLLLLVGPRSSRCDIRCTSLPHCQPRLCCSGLQCRSLVLQKKCHPPLTKTAATTASTLISLSAARLDIAFCIPSSGTFKGKSQRSLRGDWL